MATRTSVLSNPKPGTILHRRVTSATATLQPPIEITRTTHNRSCSDTAGLVSSMSHLRTDDEPYVGGHYDALASIDISFLGPDGSLHMGNVSQKENKAARRHLGQVFGATTQYFCEPWVVLGCTPSVPVGRLPELVGGLIAIWRQADDMDFSPKIGEFGQAEKYMVVDASILEGFQDNRIPGKDAVARLIGSVFPTCIAITYVAGTVVVELPRSEESVFRETLMDMPPLIERAPFNLQYHNGPLTNVGRRRRAQKPKPQVAEEDRVADETDYVAKDGQFYPGTMLSSVDKKGNTYSSASAGVLVQKGGQQRLICSWHCWEEHDKKYPGLFDEDSNKAREVFRIIQGEGGTEVGRVVERVGQTDIALAKLHPGIKFVNNFMDINTNAKSLVPSNQVRLYDRFLIDGFSTGKQTLVSLGRRFEPKRAEGEPHSLLLEKRLDEDGEEIDVVMPKDEVVYIAGEQGVSGTSDNIQTEKPYIRDSACGSALVRCFAENKKHLPMKDMLALGEICGMFHYADPTSKYADSASKYLIYADAFDPLIDGGWTIVPPQGQSDGANTELARIPHHEKPEGEESPKKKRKV
ncbi:hypothetical protein GGS23DRAFT_158705 [Durotheca rogersii]|uniref:uncharacterized protein n=1 Tax=Durotheca rogersii TaxID=419775 RepID=UPI002220042D|nr:uncharacterized protein GGS23DRAFT_158705 [Durotheca rogersii]KAI5861225.1 hypothetical protein GGS23DRAFT_158705 [Durotheca rogersii]